MPALQTSQELVNFVAPVGLNWNEHSLAFAYRVTGRRLQGVGKPGIARDGQRLEQRKKVSAASRQPARMMGLRPTRSDNAPI